MFKYSTTLYLALWNALALGLTALGYAYGYVGPVFMDDHTHLTAGLAILMTWALVQTHIKAWEVDRHQADPSILQAHPLLAMRLTGVTAFADFLKNKVFLYVGLFATAVGLTMVIRGMMVSGGDAAAIDAGIKAMQGAMFSAFYPQMTSIACKIWCEVITYILGNQAELVKNSVLDKRRP